MNPADRYPRLGTHGPGPPSCTRRICRQAGWVSFRRNEGGFPV